MVDYPLSDSYSEISVSAGFLATYQKMQRKAWVVPGTYDVLVPPGINSLMKNVATTGEVKNVSAGTGMGWLYDRVLLQDQEDSD